MKTAINIVIDSDELSTVTDQYLADLWHVSQANPAPMEDREAGEIAEAIGREIISRFLRNTPPSLWNHQGKHAYWYQLRVWQGRISAGEPEVSRHG